jgi:hypothetical protein
MFQDIIVILFVGMFLYAFALTMWNAMVESWGLLGTLLFIVASVLIFILVEARKL